MQDATQGMSRLRAGAAALSPSLPLRFAQGFGSLKGQLREGEGSVSKGSLISERLKGIQAPCKNGEQLRWKIKEAF